MPSSRDVLAASAGVDNWKTWAGRSHGSDGFELLDLVRGVKRQVCHKFVWTVPSKDTPCPICMTPPTSRKGWFLTSACGHAVCRDCLKAYAASLVQDASHRGPLRCPHCLLPLRPKDAVVALANDEELLKQWDAKIRDEVLRALPNYRHCPHCSNSAKKSTKENNAIHTHYTDDASPSSSSLSGGGFVTPECLAPIHESREQRAHKILNLDMRILLAIGGLFTILYMKTETQSFFVNIVLLLTFAWLARRAWMLARGLMAQAARNALFEPIQVECPCCSESFILNAKAELAVEKTAADHATQEWIGNNTRPCPSCSVPISKLDGCNHIQCSHCRVRFCWACMRTRTSCAAYNCNNGAPYGNAGQHDRNAEQIVDNNTENNLMERIYQLERRATRLDQTDQRVLVAIVMLLVFRESQPVQHVAEFVVTAIAFLPSGGIQVFILGIVVFEYVRGVVEHDMHARHRRRGGGGGRRRQERRNSNLRRELEHIGITESQMMREALARSLLER